MAGEPQIAAEDGEMVPVSQPRAYQLELYEESMKRNLIVTVRTISVVLDPMVSLTVV